MMDYKKFVEASKFVTGYDKMNLFKKLVFNIEAPIKYKKFKKNFGKNLDFLNKKEEK